MTKTAKDNLEVIAVVALCLVVLAAISGGLMFGIPAYSRYQAVQYASNKVKVTEVSIQNTAQLVDVETKKAAVRVAEAKGIAESQKLIDSSLTHNYLQYLAIKAQENMAGSPNHTQIYIPSGPNGIPLVKTIGGD
jgi:hypothetical protein